MDLSHIRNFSIIAHIDHGKSTLADRLLEVTGTIEKRKMREQVLDSMDLERERGITIKMAPVRIQYGSYVLNLIDTPGHIDFSYEVSRAMQAVEGVLLLVDATQGVQAQTLSVLELARAQNLAIIPVVNKIDLPAARVEQTKHEIAELLGCQTEEIVVVSGKTGDGVRDLLEQIVKRIPPPRSETTKGTRALVFDFSYSTHQGVIVYVRVVDGEIKKGDRLIFGATREEFNALDVGVFRPEKQATAKLGPGEIGYVVTGSKEPGKAKVGDTLLASGSRSPVFPGYREPQPVVWASLYPESQDDFNLLRQSLGRLRLSDASLSFEEESSGALGRGFRCGFLGLLHLEIVTERLRREFKLSLITASPTIGYQVNDRFIYSPHSFPEETKNVKVVEPYVVAKIILPPEYLNGVLRLFNEHEVQLKETQDFSAGRLLLLIELPLRELVRNFFDELKSVSSGFASFSYQLADMRPADVARVDVLVNGELVAAFSRIVGRRRVESEAEAVVERLKSLMPKQLITIKLQAKALGRIIASRTISALRKDVTDYLYGGDITRKMKLREKQKKGKKKMQAIGSVRIPPDVFLKLIGSVKE